MPSKSQPDHFLNIHEVAEIIGLHWTTIRDRKCGTGEIPRIKLSNRCLRFSFNAVQAWMTAKAHEAEEAQRMAKTIVIDLLAEKRQRQRAIEKTLTTIINGGKYR